MRGKIGDSQCLFHIVKWCRKLRVVQVDVQTYEQFIAKKNYRLVDVSAFYIGQIGELARNLSEEMRAALADISWKQIIAMRNILIHNYYDCDPQIIWEVITKHAPDLEKKCLEVLRKENENVDAELCEVLSEETGIEWEAENVCENKGDSELPARAD